MANPENVELEVEAAKFLQKLIQDQKSIDEPTELATKLYVIKQCMRSDGRESTKPYEVVSRALETITNENNLDIETIMSSRFPHLAAVSSQPVAPASEPYASTGVHTGPANSGHDLHQGSAAQITGGVVNVHGVSPCAPFKDNN